MVLKLHHLEFANSIRTFDETPCRLNFSPRPRRSDTVASSDEPSPEQLARHFHFDDIDHTLIARKRGAHNRLGFAIQLGTVRHLGAFLLDPIDVPRPVITYVGRQLHLDSSTSLLRYLERKQTRHAHCAEIRKVGSVADGCQMTR